MTTFLSREDGGGLEGEKGYEKNTNRVRGVSKIGKAERKRRGRMRDQQLPYRFVILRWD